VRSSGDLLDRLHKLVREAAPLGYCLPCLAFLLDVTQKQARDTAQLLMVPAGRFTVAQGTCPACSKTLDVFRVVTVPPSTNGEPA
jgi:hypothetical protein